MTKLACRCHDACMNDPQPIGAGTGTARLIIGYLISILRWSGGAEL